MDRKKTIIVAVFINSGLLAILALAALTGGSDEPAPSSILADATPAFASIEELPELVKPNDTPPLQLPFPAQVTAAVAAPQEPIIHQLPPLAIEPPAPQPVAAIAPPVNGMKEVTVKKGESLEKIAKANHTSVDELIKLNHLPSSFLRVGQVLKLPSSKAVAQAPKETKEKAVEAAPDYYTVKVGDNPWTIAMKNHMKVDELLRLNALNEEKARKLKPGDRLRIR